MLRNNQPQDAGVFVQHSLRIKYSLSYPRIMSRKNPFNEVWERVVLVAERAKSPFYGSFPQGFCRNNDNAGFLLL